MQVVVLDSPFPALDVETQVAERLGVSLERWRGTHQELRSADAVLHVRTAVNAQLIGDLQRCRAIGRYGTGLDTVDRTAAQQAGIEVVGVRDYCVPELASHTLAMAFSLERRLREAASGAWRSWEELAARLDIRGRTRATVVGFGSIGRAVAVGLGALGYEVKVVTRRGRSRAEQLGFEVVDVDEGFRRAELLFLHLALDRDAPPLIGHQALERLPAGALLINTARLGHIDEVAVADALATGQLAGFGLDAQISSTSPLREWATDSRVVITPHVGWYSERSARELRKKAVELVVSAAEKSTDTNGGVMNV